MQSIYNRLFENGKLTLMMQLLASGFPATGLLNNLSNMELNIQLCNKHCFKHNHKFVFGIAWTFVCTKVNIIKCKCNIRISILIFKQVSASALITSESRKIPFLEMIFRICIYFPSLTLYFKYYNIIHEIQNNKPSPM